MRTPGWAAVASLVLAACAAPPPVTVNSTYVTPPPPAPAKATAPARCKLAVVELTDGRRTPEVLGVVSGRAVKGPDDPKAWLRSMVDGPGDRGFDVSYTADPAARVTAKLRLQTAWVDAIRANKNANIVLHVSAGRGATPTIERDYRGSLVNINWASGEGELRGLVDKAIGKALDEIAVDLTRLCADGA